MPYHVGEKGSYGCSGYPVVKDGTSEVMGCHDSAAAAQNQITAINISEAEKTQGRKRIPSGVEGFEPAAPGLSALDGQAYEEKDTITNEGGIGIRSPQAWPGTRISEEERGRRKEQSNIWSGSFGPRMRQKSNYNDNTGDWFNAKPIPETSGFRSETETRNNISREIGKEMEIKEGDFVMGPTADGEAARRHIMRRARALGRTDLLPAEWTGEKFWDIRDLTKTDRFMVKADSLRVGQMVSWNSSGGRAQGKVTRIIRSGSYNVPNSDFVIDATEENPAVVITLYRDGKPTDTTVAHRMSTLRAI